MIASHPLQNKQVMVPRAEEQAGAFSRLVERYGGIPVEIPLIAFRPVPLTEKSLSTIKNIHNYDWIVFTSNVTVNTFLSHQEVNAELFPKVAAIGEKTRQVLREHGIHVDFMPSEYTAEGFVQEFLKFVKPGTNVIIPKGNLARELIAASIKQQGGRAEELVIYETYMPEKAQTRLTSLLKENQLDILTFTSPSTVDHFINTVREHSLAAAIEGKVVACIGPVTKRRAEKAGLTVHVCPEKYTVEEMLKDIVKLLTRKL